jgi:uncharacterized membrane protein
MQGKSAVGSVTIISALVVIAAQLAQLVGYTISEDDQQALVNIVNSGLIVITTIVSMIGAVGTIWGRLRATKQITGVVTPAPAPPLSPSPPGTTTRDLNLEELARHQ